MAGQTWATRAAQRDYGWADRLVVAIALAAAFLGVGLASTTGPAYADVVTNSYAIGTITGPVSSVSATPAQTTAGTPTPFELTFYATAELAGGSAISVGDSSAADSVVAGAAQVQVADGAGTCLEPAPTYSASASAGLVVTLGAACDIAIGDKVDIDFTTTAPPAPGVFVFDVVTSANVVAATSNAIAVDPKPPTVSTSSPQLGANATYTISGVPVGALSPVASSLVVVAKASGAGGTVSWYGGAPGYSVTYTPTGGSSVVVRVSSVTVSKTVNADDTVTLALASALAGSGNVDLTAEGTNPSAESVNGFTVAIGGGPAVATTNNIAYGSSVSNVRLSVSAPVAGSSTTYTVSFRATTAVVAGEDIFISEPGTDFSQVTGIEITDSQQGWASVASGQTLSNGAATVPLGRPVAAGDTVVVTLVNVTNPPASTVTDFTVATSADPVPTAAPPYTIGAGAGSGVTVLVNPVTPGAQATYSISDFHATSIITGGSGTITLTAPPGTVFPNNPSYYFVQDTTGTSGPQTVVALTGGGSNSVSLTVPQTIDPGDSLSLSIGDTFNPDSAGTYQISLGGDVAGPGLGPVFPGAAVTYPDGALVSFSGTLYVLAGGHAFGVPTPSAAAGVEAVDHALVSVSATAVPGTNAVHGTLVVAYNKPTIYVVGTDGQLHGFATPAQFLGAGYDPAEVVTVPNLGRMAVGATVGAEGPAANALATASNGAVIDSSGTYFVLAGGRAFGIPNLAALKATESADVAKPLLGTIGTLGTAGIADGTLLTAGGIVYTAYEGDLYPFKSMKQLMTDGYGGTASIPVPSTGGLNVVSQYSGS